MSNNTIVQDTSIPSEASDRNDDDASLKKRKRKGFGNWTRSALACDRCRKKKIKCVEEKPCANCVSAAVDCITSQNGTQHAAKPPNVDSSDGSLQRRIELLEAALQTRQSSHEPPQNNISSSATGIEGLLSLAQPSHVQPNTDALMSSTSPHGTISSTSGSPTSHMPHGQRNGTPYRKRWSTDPGEGNHKRWGAKSALGQSCNPLEWPRDIIDAWIPSIDPSFQAPSTVGLPGADEPCSPVQTQSLILPGFPSSEYAQLLLDAYFNGVAPLYNIIHPPTIKEMLNTVCQDGVQTLTLTEQALFFMIFALGALVKNDPKSELFYKQAQGVAVDIFAETSAESTVFSFLTALYQQITGRLSAAWTTFGVVVRIAEALGYHRNVSNWGLSPFHEECRRRVWANIYIMDAYQSLVYGRPPIIHDSECDVLPPSTLALDVETTVEKTVPSAAASSQFHLEYYQLCRIIHHMMKRLYLDVESKYDPWDTIRTVTENLREFQVSIPENLRIENLNVQDEVVQQQAIYLYFLFNHTMNICCRPLLRRQTPSVSAPVAQHRRAYCQGLAETASNQIATRMDYAPRCFLGTLLFGVCGIFLGAAEVFALQAIASPKESPAATDAWRHLNNLLALLTNSRRPGPLTPQSMSILQDLIRIVASINARRNPGTPPYHDAVPSIPPDQRMNFRSDTQDSAIRGDETFPPDLLSDFLSGDGFPTLAMDDLIWMPEIWNGKGVR